MFVLKEVSDGFTWPVDIKTPADNGGFKKNRIQIDFTALRQSEIDEHLVADDKALLLEVVTGWSGVQDEDGNELEFSEEALERLLDIPAARIAMVTTYLQGVGGYERKN